MTDASMASLGGPDDREAMPNPPRIRPFIRAMQDCRQDVSERYGLQPGTVDSEFLSYLTALARFGFFSFGPVTIDVRVVEDTYERTRTHKSFPARQPLEDDWIRFSERLIEEVRRSGREQPDELHYLLAFMRTPEGLPVRVFGELGVRAEEVEAHARGLGTAAPDQDDGAGKLYSTEEAAEYFSVHVQTVRSWIRSGRLPAVRLAGQKSIRIRERDLQAVLEPIQPSDFG